MLEVRDVRPRIRLATRRSAPPRPQHGSDRLDCGGTPHDSGWCDGRRVIIYANVNDGALLDTAHGSLLERLETSHHAADAAEGGAR